MTPIAHAGGLDEFAFVALPLLIFLTLQWLSRRKAGRSGEQENGPRGTNDSGAQ